MHKSEDAFRVLSEAVEPRELWKAQIRPLQQPGQQLPPPYEDSLSDLPPDYSPTDTSAVAYCDAGNLKPLLPCSGSEKLDLDEIKGIRSYAKKKKKAAPAAKWNDDEEEKKEEGADGAGGGEGGDNGGGEGGGEGAGDGAGGDPPGGDGGGDENPEDDWFSGGGKKNKKKKKKNAFEEFEEEEKKREEEEAKLAEEAGGEPPPPAEPEPDPIDDWGSFAPAGGKKKVRISHLNLARGLARAGGSSLRVRPLLPQGEPES